MKIVLIVLFSLAIYTSAVAQTKQQPDTSVVKEFGEAEKPAEFPGGSEGWRTYLEKNMKYPKKAMKANIQGVVKVQFIVETTGAVSEVAVISEPGGGLGDEVVRLISKGPKWIPAEQGGKKVKFRHIQAVTFALE
ncbi:MAG TPA: energy transducer TonB [Phnomibacter sp.]|nr:energy transducer TonB [Phnomibacter sp.]